MAPHIHEKIDFTVEVFIVYKDKVLLRKHDKYGFWLSIGGHIELNEDPVEAAHREVREEVGLEIELFGNPMPPIFVDDTYRELMPPKYMNRHNIGKSGHEHVSLVYFARATSDDVVAEKAGDVWKWLTKEDVEKNTIGLKADIQFYALKALEELAS